MSSLTLASPHTPSLQLDHVGVCAYDLKSLQAAFAAIGLGAEYGGAHASGGTDNALLGFDDGSYIELIAREHPAAGGGEDARLWKNLQPGMSRACFWAIHTDNLQALVDSFHQAKIAIREPQAGGRKKPDGTVLQWRTAAVPDDRGGDILPFAIEDITSRDLRIQPSASVKGSELTGVKRVIIGVNNLAAAVAIYRKAFRLGKPELHAGGVPLRKQAYFPGTAIILEQSSPGLRGADQVSSFGEGPTEILLGTRDLEQTRRRGNLVDGGSWFGHKIMWFERATARQVHLGVITE
jgi:hypothetical protein